MYLYINLFIFSYLLLFMCIYFKRKQDKYSFLILFCHVNHITHCMIQDVDNLAYIIRLENKYSNVWYRKIYYVSVGCW